MAVLGRILSLPTAKPYRTKDIRHSESRPPTLNSEGHVTWDEDDVENPQNWSNGKKWLITALALVMTVNVCVLHCNALHAYHN